MTPKFIVDRNVGKLTRWLRMMGYDALLFDGPDDGAMVKAALAEGRVVLTRDTQVMQRRVVASGELRALLLRSDDPARQLQQVVMGLGLDYRFRPFSVCLECNRPLETRGKDEVRRLVPSYVFRTQEQYMQCPACRRVYWRGTHWEAMERVLRRLEGGLA
ncbi:MAG: Mut7-C RNAse domain-containing protein [Chloroflexota bacterium]